MIRKGPLYFIAAVFILFIYIVNQSANQTELTTLLAAGGLLLFLLIYYMLSKNKLIIDDEGITQQLFFGKEKRLIWHDIKASNLSWHFHGHGGSLEWSVIPYSGKHISWQTSFYSRSQLQLIAEAIVTKCEMAVIDERIKNVAMGKFPWYIF